MNRTDKQLEMLASRARQSLMTVESPVPIGFTDDVIKACCPLPRLLPTASCCASETSRDWSFAGLLTRSRSEPDGALLLMRYSLVSLPIGAIVMLACLFWFGADLSHDLDDLAVSFMQSPWVP